MSRAYHGIPEKDRATFCRILRKLLEMSEHEQEREPLIKTLDAMCFLRNSAHKSKMKGKV